MIFRLSKVVFFLLLAAQLQAQQRSRKITGQQDGRPVVTAVPFVSITPDARSAAMGDAGGAISADANANYWNPAKLAFLDDNFGVSLSFTPWLQKIVGDMSITYLAGYKKLTKNQALGFSMRYFDLGSIDFRDSGRRVIAQFNPREFTFDATFAMKLSERFSIGGTGRFIYSNLAGNISVGNNDARPGATAAVDFSTYYVNDKISLGAFPAQIALAAVLSNVGFKMSYSSENKRDFIPTNLRLGTALTTDLDAFNKVTLAFDINKLLVPTPPLLNDSTGQIIAGRTTDRSMLSGIFGSFSDAPNGFSEELQELIYTAGVEYWYNGLFALRGGYFHEHKNKGNRKYFTIGVGIRYQIFGLDFAYLIAKGKQNPLEDTLRFTLQLNLGKGKKSSDS